MHTLDVKNIKQGEYVKRKADAKTVFVRGHYDAATKSYSLSDTEDFNREVFVKSGTQLFVGFDY